MMTAGTAGETGTAASLSDTVALLNYPSIMLAQRTVRAVMTIVREMGTIYAACSSIVETILWYRMRERTELAMRPTERKPQTGINL